MAEGLTTRGIQVTQVEMLPEVLPTVDVELGALVHAELGPERCRRPHPHHVTRISRRTGAEPASTSTARPSTANHCAGTSTSSWSSSASAQTPTSSSEPERGPGTAAPWWSTSPWLPDSRTYGRPATAWSPTTGSSARTYLPLGTTAAHKQGRVAGENAVGGNAEFAGSLGTQVVKVFDLVAARTGLREHEATAAGFTPSAPRATPDDHKAYYPGATPITIRITGDGVSGRLLGAQLIGTRGAEISKRVDTYATALFHEMTVTEHQPSSTCPTPRRSGSPWDAVQMAAQAWVAEHQRRRRARARSSGPEHDACTGRAFGRVRSKRQLQHDVRGLAVRRPRSVPPQQPPLTAMVPSRSA